MGQGSIPIEKQISDFWYGVLLTYSNLVIIRTSSYLIQDGFNLVYHLTTDLESYILRASYVVKPIPLEKDDYLSELEILDFLGNHNISVATPIKWKSGEYLLKITDNQKNQFYCSIFTFAGGKPVLPLSEAEQYQLGVFLGELHHLLGNYSPLHTRINWDITNGVIRPINQFKQFRGSQNPDECLHLDKIQNWLVYNLPKYGTSLPRGFVHGDVHNYNIHFQEDGQFMIFDFDFMARSYLVYDIACFIGTERWFIESNNLEALEISYNSLIEGYESIRTLNTKELEILPILEIIRWLILLGAWAELCETRDKESFKINLPTRFKIALDKIDWLMNITGNIDLYLNRTELNPK